MMEMFLFFFFIKDSRLAIWLGSMGVSKVAEAENTCTGTRAVTRFFPRLFLIQPKRSNSQTTVDLGVAAAPL